MRPDGRQRTVGLFAAVEIGRSGDGHFKLAFINTDALFSGYGLGFCIAKFAALLLFFVTQTRCSCFNAVRAEAGSDFQT